MKCLLKNLGLICYGETGAEQEQGGHFTKHFLKTYSAVKLGKLYSA